MKIDQNGVYTLIYTAEDECGNKTEAERTVEVVSPIYGAEWDGTATTKMARTDRAIGFPDPQPAVANGMGSSPFDDIMPWAGMKRVTVATTSDVDNEFVEVPEFYYLWTMQESGNGFKIQISPTEVDGFYRSPSFRIARYLCNSNYHSVSGAIPVSNVSGTNMLSGINGNSIPNAGSMRYSHYLALLMLYLVEFADTNSQGCIGNGCSESGQIEASGGTDAMLYHTGTNKSTREEYGVTQYRHIEGLWNNVAAYCGHIEINNGVARFVGNDAAQTATIPLPSSNGYITKLGCAEYPESAASPFRNPKGQFVFPTETVPSSGTSANSFLSDQYIVTTPTAETRAAFGGRAFRSPLNGIMRVAYGNQISAISDVGIRMAIKA